MLEVVLHIGTQQIHAMWETNPVNIIMLEYRLLLHVSPITIMSCHNAC